MNQSEHGMESPWDSVRCVAAAPSWEQMRAHLFRVATELRSQRRGSEMTKRWPRRVITMPSAVMRSSTVSESKASPSL